MFLQENSKVFLTCDWKSTKLFVKNHSGCTYERKFIKIQRVINSYIYVKENKRCMKQDLILGVHNDSRFRREIYKRHYAMLTAPELIQANTFLLLRKHCYLFKIML